MKTKSLRSRPGLIAAAVLAAFVLSACASPVGNYFAPTAAVVNGEKISEEKVSSSLRLALTDPQNQGLFTGVSGVRNRLDAQRQVLGDVIQLELVLQQSRKLGVAVREGEVTERLNQIKGNFPDEKTFQSEVEKRRLTIQFIRDRLREQLLTERVTERVTTGVSVTQEEIQQEYTTGTDRFAEQFHVAHVLICKEFDSTTGSCNVTDADLSTARDVAARARTGEDFAKLAAEFSIDPSTKDSGGDLGFRPPGTFVPEFEQAVSGLEPGSISDPVKTQFGYHVIRVIAKGRPIDEVREAIQSRLLQPRRDQAFREWLSGALKSATIRINPKFGRFDRNSLTVVPIEGAEEPPRTQTGGQQPGGQQPGGQQPGGQQPGGQQPGGQQPGGSP